MATPQRAAAKSTAKKSTSKSVQRKSTTKKTTAKSAGRSSTAQLAELRARLATVDQALCTVEYGPGGGILSANDNFCRALGYEADDLVGEHRDMLVAEAVAISTEYRAIWDKLRRGEQVACRIERVGKDATEACFQSVCTPIMDAHGDLVKVLELASDVTALRSELFETQAELKLRSDMMNMTSLISETDKRGHIVWANEKFCDVAQYTLDELVGQNHNIVRHPDMPKATFKKVWQTIGAGEMFRGKIKNRAKDGTPYYVDAVIAPVLGKNGKPMKYIGSRYDITDLELERHNMQGLLAALDRSQAMIEFDLDGNVLSANENFCDTMGYTLEEISGRHHRIFVEPQDAASPEYAAFWERLRAGEFSVGEYRRIGKGGREVWLQASYNPVCDEMGRVFKVVKLATDITARKLRNADYEGQIEAIGKAQAVIEFQLDGTIVNANENFCKTLGYSVDELRGKHHSMLVDAAEAASPQYRAFWESLRRGEYHTGQFRRVGKGGKDVWIQANYSPILDMNGRPFKVVKFATDVTDQVTGANDVEAVLQALAAGDLTQSVTAEHHGVFKRMSDNVNQAVAELAELLGQIGVASETINTAASEIASGNQDLSQRTEEQASSLQETASSMEELTATVRQNADNARQANQLAATASDVAAKGGSVVSEVVTTMESITESSKKIVDIISVIDGIAFQTNILALNAAVEAARAGEQGRGFAVVASEVRSLAQRSAAAAKEIKTLIGDSVEKVGAGSKLVESAGQTMEEIVSSVKRVTDIMGEITAASQEQASGIEQVNQAITQMDQVTQQNAALVEEASAAAESMRSQAVNLSEAMNRFKFEDGDEPQWDGVAPRRGPHRATNVAHLPLAAARARPTRGQTARPAPATGRTWATGTTDELGDWEEF